MSEHLPLLGSFPESDVTSFLLDQWWERNSVPFVHANFAPERDLFASGQRVQGDSTVL